MKQISKNSNSNQPNWFQKFFWFCSGVDVDLLTGNYAQFPTPLKAEYNKYIGVGTAVFFTSLFASISAAFALSFMEGSKWWICMIFGLVWGINIFFLDRYIVATMRKEDNRLKELLYASPRIAIGLVFAFTIAVPIELSLFSGKIGDELSKYNKGRVNECQKVCDEKISNLNKQIADLDNQVKAKQAQQPQGYQELLKQQKGLQLQVNQIASEISRNEGIISSNRSPNLNYPEASSDRYIYNQTAQKYQYLNRIKSGELSSQRNQLGQINNEIQVKFKKHQDEIDNLTRQIELQKMPLINDLSNTSKSCPLDIEACRNIAAKNNDLLSRYDALGKAKASSGGSSIWWASFVITLLFIFLELAPVLSKLISNKGSYDERLESLEATERLITSEQNNEINEKLLDIESENEKSKELRRFSKEEEKIKLATKLFETQEKENLEKSKISEEMTQRKNRQELMAILEGKGIKQQLEEAKATFNITVDTILSGEEAEKQLQKKVADYIANKQFEHLKNEVDDFFENKTKTELIPSEQYHLS